MKTSLRLPDDLAKQLKAAQKHVPITMAALIVWCIKEGLPIVLARRTK